MCNWKEVDAEAEELFRTSHSSSSGVLVEAADGRIYFLPNEEAAKFEVAQDKSGVHRAVMHAGRKPPISIQERRASGGEPVKPQPVEPLLNCRNLLRWLLSNDPDNEMWRRFSVVWMYHCF